MSKAIQSESYIEQRIAHFAQKAAQSSSFEAWKFAMSKMLEWKKRRSPDVVQRLDAERLEQVRAGAKVASGNV